MSILKDFAHAMLFTTLGRLWCLVMLLLLWAKFA